jgi:hypothetical protein
MSGLSALAFWQTSGESKHCRVVAQKGRSVTDETGLKECEKEDHYGNDATVFS